MMITPAKPLTADEVAARRQQLAKTLMLTRYQMAWGDEIGSMKVTKVWPADAKAWRAYPHEPNAEIDMALAQADAVIATIEQQAEQIEKLHQRAYELETAIERLIRGYGGRNARIAKHRGSATYAAIQILDKDKALAATEPVNDKR